MILYHTKLKLYFIATALTLILLVAPAIVSASWHGLTPGKYEVGFKTIEKYDYARTFMPKYDYFGNLIEGERARPIQICIWYPAMAPLDAQRMVYGEYNFPYPEDDRFFNVISRFQGQDTGYLFYAFQNNQGVVLDFLSVEMNAVKDAKSVDGKFPLLIYFSNLKSGIGDNVLLCEYLASQGFVIVTSHSYGTRELGAQMSQGDLETQLTDKEFIFANIKDLPNIDMDKIGTLGSGFGGLASMLFPMRCGDIDASLSLNNPCIVQDYIEFTSNCPYFAKKNLTVPYMNVYSSDIGEVNLSLLDTLKYSERFSLWFSETPRTAFTSHRLLSTMMPGQEKAVDEVERKSYQAICQYSLNFFNAYLNKSEAGKKYIYNIPKSNNLDPNLMTISFIPANDVPPSPAEFIQIIRGEGGVSKAVELYEKFKIEQPEHQLFSEAALNAIGYGLLTNAEIENAIQLFRMNSEVYPKSCNVWDSYTDGLTAAGETEKAIDCMRKAMEVMPDDPANEGVKEAIRQHARQILGEIEFAKYEKQ